MDLPLDKIPRMTFLCFVSDELPHDDEAFLAVLTERAPWGVHPREYISEIFISVVPEAQRHLIKQGALFTLVADPRKKVAEITFEEQRPWTEEEIEEAKERASYFKEIFETEDGGMVVGRETSFTFEDDYEFRRAEGAVAHQGSERATDAPIDSCDACGEPGMQLMSGCKRLCRKCGFLRSCTDTV